MTTENAAIAQRTEELAKEFAKANKIGFAKVKAFIDSLPAQPRSNPNAGRKASLETVKLRNDLFKWLEENKGVEFTVKQLAEKLKAEPIHINNALGWVTENTSVKLVKTGQAEKAKGQRGRAATVYQALAA